MKKSRIFKIYTILSLLFLSLYAQELNWLHDYDKALIEAKKEHKDVYLFIGADRCKFCDAFKKTALQDRAVLKRLHSEYILLYLSRDQHQIPDKFEQFGVPRHYFINKHNKVFFETWGGYEAEGFQTILDEAELNSDETK